MSPPTAPPPRRSLALVAVALLGLSLLVVAPRALPAGADDTAAPIDWGPCEAHPAPFECGLYQVPVDHADPDGPTIGVAVLRHPATDPGARIGSLFLNPGGPGGDALEVAAAVTPALDPAVTAAFDIVALNPRGVAGSAPSLECPQEQEASAPPADWGAYFAANAPVKAASHTACQMAWARTGARYGTVQVAQDLDLLRRAVGDEKLTYWGISYGTRIGEVYAQMFPDRIRAMILDGNVDPNSTALTFTSERGGSFDQALDFFFAQMPGTEDAIDQITAELAVTGPIEVTNAATGAPLTITADDALSQLVAGLVASESVWPAIENQLVSVLEQLDGGPTAQVYVEVQSDNFGTVLQQVNCLDLPDRPGLAAMTAAAQQMVLDGPRMGWQMAAGLDLCSGFPLPPDPAPAQSPSGIPPVLLLSSLNDPATPYEWSGRMQQFLPGSVRITYGGTQHGVWNLVPSACVNDAANAYVLDLVVPADGLQCPFVMPAVAPPSDEDLALLEVQGA